MSDEHKSIFVKDELFQTDYPSLESDNFISTKTTEPLEKSLINFLGTRDIQIAGEFSPSAGLKGFMIEGGPGVGKAVLIKRILESRGIFPDNPKDSMENITTK
jgi:predicted ATPase with chaperone activity